jgi:hypothetical protein
MKMNGYSLPVQVSSVKKIVPRKGRFPFRPHDTRQDKLVQPLPALSYSPSTTFFSARILGRIDSNPGSAIICPGLTYLPVTAGLKRDIIPHGRRLRKRVATVSLTGATQLATSSCGSRRQHLHFASDDLGSVTVVAILVFPLPRLQLTLNIDPGTFR